MVELGRGYWEVGIMAERSHEATSFAGVSRYEGGMWQAIDKRRRCPCLYGCVLWKLSDKFYRCLCNVTDKWQVQKGVYVACSAGFFA